MRTPLACLLALCFGIGPAAGDRPGIFDHYLLALSWTPGWCAIEGEARGAETCAPGAATGWSLHGLWPQHERGWPEWCEAATRDPSRRETAAMADIMGSAGLAWHQWRRHGRCTGLEPDDYFALSRQAFAAVALPEPGALGERVRPDALEEAVRAANPGIPEGGLVAICRDGVIHEIRICLTRDLGFRRCEEDVRARSCRATDPLAMPPPP